MKCNLEKNRKKLQIDFEHWWHDYYLQNQLGIACSQIKTQQNANSDNDDTNDSSEQLSLSTTDSQTQSDIKKFYKMKNDIFKRQAMIDQLTS